MTDFSPALASGLTFPVVHMAKIGDDPPRKQLAGIRKKPRRARPKKAWEHREASWEAHRRRRAEDYGQEMKHAFSCWYGVGLHDWTDGDEPLYDPRDPDPDYPGWIKTWRPRDEVQRLMELCATGPARDTARQNFQDFLNDHLDTEYNLNYGRWALTLKRSFSALPVCVARDRILWVLDHCLEWRDGDLD